MNEAQLTAQLLTTNEIFFTGVSLGFTIYSAYILGLFWFLHRAGLLLKMVAFALLTLCTALIAIASFGIVRHAQGVTLSLKELDKTEPLSQLGTMAISETADGVSGLISLGGGSLILFIYFGALYLTFFYRWDSLNREK